MGLVVWGWEESQIKLTQFELKLPVCTTFDELGAGVSVFLRLLNENCLIISLLLKMFDNWETG